MQFSDLTAYVDSLSQQFHIPGCDLVIYHDHKKVYRHSAGFNDYERTKPVTSQDLYFCYSTTKPMTMTAAVRLIQEGRLRLTDKVSDYLPEFAHLQIRDGQGTRPYDGQLTVQHLMTMTSGITYDLDTPYIRQVLAEHGTQTTTRQLVAAFARQPLSFEPGAYYQYGLSHDVIAAIIEVITGQTYGEYIDEIIFKPLGMADSGFHLTDSRKKRLAAQYMYDMDRRMPDPMPMTNGFTFSDQYESGGAGLISTVDDYIKFASTLANGGTAENGYVLLDRASIDLMRKPQLSEQCLTTYDKWKDGYSYGLGVRTKVKQVPQNARSPIGEFGWDGAAGAYVMIDTENDLAIFYVQHCRKCLVAFDIIQPTLRDLTYEALNL